MRAPADYGEQEGELAPVYLVDAQRSAQQGIFTTANHDELSRSGGGGYLGGFQPDKVSPWHDFSIGDDRSKSLFQDGSFVR